MPEIVKRNRNHVGNTRSSLDSPDHSGTTTYLRVGTADHARAVVDSLLGVERSLTNTFQHSAAPSDTVLQRHGVVLTVLPVKPCTRTLVSLSGHIVSLHPHIAIAGRRRTDEDVLDGVLVGRPRGGGRERPAGTCGVSERRNSTQHAYGTADGVGCHSPAERATVAAERTEERKDMTRG